MVEQITQERTIRLAKLRGFRLLVVEPPFTPEEVEELPCPDKYDLRCVQTSFDGGHTVQRIYYKSDEFRGEGVDTGFISFADEVAERTNATIEHDVVALEPVSVFGDLKPI